MKKLLASIVVLCGFAAVSPAQTQIRGEKISHDGTNVTVTFEIDTDKAEIPSRRKEVLLPYLYNGKDTLFLDALEVYGRGRYKRERQTNAINGDREWELSENQTLKNKGVCVYTSRVPLRRWMTQANFGIRRQLVGCACE